MDQIVNILLAIDLKKKQFMYPTIPLPLVRLYVAYAIFTRCTHRNQFHILLTAIDNVRKGRHVKRNWFQLTVVINCWRETWYLKNIKIVRYDLLEKFIQIHIIYCTLIWHKEKCYTRLRASLTLPAACCEKQCCTWINS